MSTFHFEFLMCLKGHPVPLVKKTWLVMGPNSMAEAEGLGGDGGGLGVCQCFCRALVDPPGLGLAYQVVGVAQQQGPIAHGDS